MALNPQLIRALDKALRTNPKVERVSPKEYKVVGSTGAEYTVRTRGHEVVCNCIGFERTGCCYHVAAVQMDCERRKLERESVDPEHAPIVNPVPRGRAGLGLTEAA